MVIWLYYVRHQLYFFLKLDNVLNSLNFERNKLLYLRSFTQYGFIFHSLNLLDWIKNEYIRNNRDFKVYLKLRSIITKSLNHYNSNSIKVGSYDRDEIDNIRFNSHVVYNLLSNISDDILNLKELVKICINNYGESENIGIGFEVDRKLNKELEFLKEIKLSLNLEIKRKPRILTEINNKSVICTKDPIISVLTPSLNLGHFLEETIYSIKNQSYVRKL